MFPFLYNVFKMKYIRMLLKKRPMNLNFFRSIQHQRPHFIGLITIALFSCVGLVGYVSFERNPASLTSKIIILVSIIGSILVAAVTIWSVYRKTIKPVKSLVKLGRKLTKKNFASLMSGMSELTQGNFTVSLDIQSEHLPSPDSSEMGELVDIFNTITKSLQETAEEFNKLTDTPSLRLCYVGADSYLEGCRCGEIMGEALGGKGEVAISTGSFSATGSESRRKGFESVLREKYSQIKIVDIFEDCLRDELAYEHATEVLKRFPRLSGFYVTTGSTPHSVARAVVEAKKTKKITVIAHDLTDETMRYVKDGVIRATLGQDPFAQGHDPVIHLFNHLVDDWQPPTSRLLTQMDIVTPDNYHRFWDPDQGLIQSQELLDRLAKPADKKPQKPLRIAVLGRESSAFWNPVKQGALTAAEKLRPHNVSVDWIYPEKARENNDYSASVYGAAIESTVSQGYDAIATVVVDRHLIPYINRAVRAGIPIVTFNSEPCNLRNLIYIISEQGKRLMELSQNLATSSHQVSQATSQIDVSLDEMSTGSVSQHEQVSHTSKVLNDLLQNIDNMNRAAKESTASAESTIDTVGSGIKAMEKTLASMEDIEKSVSDTWNVVEHLSKYSARIDVIVELIDNVASQVNMLGVNAVIEAAGAGEYGQGFSGVAEEVRKLSKSIAKATREIVELVNSIQSGIRRVGKAMLDGQNKVKESAGLADKAVELLGGILQLVELDQNRKNNIASSITEMQKVSQQVGQAMHSVASVSEKSSEVTKDVNVSMNDIRHQLEGVAALAKSLETMAQTEQELMTKFNILDDHNTFEYYKERA